MGPGLCYFDLGMKWDLIPLSLCWHRVGHNSIILTLAWSGPDSVVLTLAWSGYSLTLNLKAMLKVFKTLTSLKLMQLSPLYISIFHS